MNWTRFVVFFVMFFVCFCPTAPFISLFRMDRASHYFFVTHIVWILWISSAKPTVNVYVVVCWRLYLHMCFYVFRITQSFDTVQVWILPDEGLVCQIASGEQFDLVLPWGDLVCAGDGPQEAPEPWQKNVRNVKGHILDGRSCKSFLDLMECEAGM